MRFDVRVTLLAEDMDAAIEDVWLMLDHLKATKGKATFIVEHIRAAHGNGTIETVPVERLS